jgi:hypothetical protein
MKKYAFILIVVVAVLGMALVFYSQSTKKTISAAAGPPPAMPPAGSAAGVAFSGKVVETMNAGGYTYVLVESGGDRIWAAGPETTVEVGETVSIPEGMEMENFESKTLNRTFDTVLFVSAIGTASSGGTPQMPMGHPSTSVDKASIEKMDFSGIETPENGKNVATLYAEKARLAGKEVIVRGKVVKYTAGVMKKNWIHLRDGSGSAGTDDLTVTTNAVVKVGDVVVARGVLNIDQDFGMGYKYEILLEDATVVVE